MNKQMIKDTLKQIEEEFDKFKLEECGKWKIDRPFAKSFLKSSIIKVLEQLVEREDKFDIKEHICRFNDGEQNCDCYLEAKHDTISYLKSEISKLSTNIDKE